MSKLTAGALVALAALSAAVSPALAVEDATIADPVAHQVVLENEHVRVISALAAPGHKSPMHSHPPLVLISLGTARARLTLADGTSQITDLRPGTVFWVPGTEHSWELLSGEINVIAVEVKAAKAAIE